MKNGSYEQITYACFIALVEEFSVLEDLLYYFQNEEITKINRNRKILESIILEQIKMCGMHRRGILAHLEECREWDTFPEEFWNKNNVEHIASFSERYPWGSDLITKLAFVAEEIKRAAKIADNCLRDYQHSGYIDHQPVAIDFLDFLIDINGQLHDGMQQMKMLITY